MIILYHNDMAVCAAKVRLALEEKGLSWESRHLNLRAGEQYKPEYKKLNPNAVVPTLIDNDEVLIESSVINEYLDQVYPSPQLRPTDAVDRARMRIWVLKLDQYFHTTISLVSFCIAFRYQLLENPNGQLAAMRKDGPDRGNSPIQQALEKGMDSPQFEPALRRIAATLDDIDEGLRSRNWLGGNCYSLADIGYTPYVARLEHLGLGSLLANRANVKDWYDRLKARKSFSTAMEKWHNPDYMKLFQEVQGGAREKLNELNVL